MNEKRQLQVFIEENIGKKYGDKYKYDMVMLATRYRGGYEGQWGPGVEVSFAIPQGLTFTMQVETDAVDTVVDFFEWLTQEFFPAMNKCFAKHEETLVGA